jgi:hypothetical protein
VLQNYSDFGAAVDQLRNLQSTWRRDKEQVTVISNGRMVLHVDTNTQNNLPAGEWWRDEMSGNRSLYPMMQERRKGFRLVQIRDCPNRLTVLAYETLDHPHQCLVVTEAHYYQ